MNGRERSPSDVLIIFVWLCALIGCVIAWIGIGNVISAICEATK